MKLLFAAVIALALTTPAWAGKHCWTQCRSRRQRLLRDELQLTQKGRRAGNPAASTLE
jgi:hypothetical protein